MSCKGTPLPDTAVAETVRETRVACRAKVACAGKCGCARSMQGRTLSDAIRLLRAWLEELRWREDGDRWFCPDCPP